MAEIKRYPFVRHLRAESSSHILRYRRGRLVRSGAGLSLWFRPLAAGIAEIPLDDQELSFHFQGRSSDFQEVTAQGVITYRVTDPETLARRVDFTLDLASGLLLKQPLEKLGLILSQLAQQFAWEYMAESSIRDLVTQGVPEIRRRISEGLRGDEDLQGTGLEIVSVRVSAISPSAELEKALQTPTREAIQQQADDATFERRARAVEKERAIQENELQNQIELARREEQLIEQQGQNKRRQASEEAEARTIEVTAQAAQKKIESTASAEAIRAVEAARVEAEREKMGIYRDLPSAVLLALGLRDMAGKLKQIDHVHLSPDLLGPVLSDLIRAGTKRLDRSVDGE